MQFSLFGELASEVPALPKAKPAARTPKRILPPEWSHSRRDLFERCLLWYYYTYYGARKGVAQVEPLKEQLRLLKSLSNFNLRAGEIMHIVIRTYLRKAKQNEPWTLERTLGWAQALYEADKSLSLNYREGDVLSKDVNAPKLLAEFYYSLINAEELWAASLERVRAALTNFITNSKFEEFRVGALEPDSQIEATVRVSSDNFRMRGQIDLAYSWDGRRKIIDWKIGGSNGESRESLQLLSYAFAAVELLKCSPEEIDLHKVYLEDSGISIYSPSDTDVKKARAFIIQDTERLMSMEQYGREGNALAFTPCEQPRVCRMCPFRAICPTQQGSNN